MKLDAWIKKACALKKHHPWPKAWALKAQKPKYSLPTSQGSLQVLEDNKAP